METSVIQLIVVLVAIVLAFIFDKKLLTALTAEVVREAEAYFFENGAGEKKLTYAIREVKKRVPYLNFLPEKWLINLIERQVDKLNGILKLKVKRKDKETAIKAIKAFNSVALKKNVYGNENLIDNYQLLELEKKFTDSLEFDIGVETDFDSDHRLIANLRRKI